MADKLQKELFFDCVKGDTRNMIRQISIHEVEFSNLNFWNYFFHVGFPRGYNTETNMTVGEMVDEIMPYNIEWVDRFTQSYDGVLDECDGYLENPTTLTAHLNCHEVLKIEFHPGDVIFFINEKNIGSIGPHPITRSYPYKKLEQLLNVPKGNLLFLLLLPMARIESDCQDTARQTIECLLHHLFPEYLCNLLAQCIVYGLIPEP